MKEYFKKLFETYEDVLGAIAIYVILILAGAFLLSPIILSICFNSGWYLLLYAIIIPVIEALDK